MKKIVSTKCKIALSINENKATGRMKNYKCSEPVATEASYDKLKILCLNPKWEMFLIISSFLRVASDHLRCECVVDSPFVATYLVIPFFHTVIPFFKPKMGHLI